MDSSEATSLTRQRAWLQELIQERSEARRLDCPFVFRSNGRDLREATEKLHAHLAEQAKNAVVAPLQAAPKTAVK